MNVLTMAMPGALRMRNLFPLVEEDGSCSLIYDLERAAVLEVPEELQLHAASALETGDLDEAVWTWMLAEDLLTAEGWLGADGAERAPSGARTRWQSRGLAFRRDNNVQARLDHATVEGAREALDFIFKQSVGVGRVTLLLSWGGGFPSPQVLAEIFVEAQCRAVAGGMDVRFELALESWEVTPAAAAFLADFPFQVHLDCGAFMPESAAEQAWSRAEVGVRRLVSLGDRLTVRCALEGEARLRDLWAWAKRLGVGRIDPVLAEEDGVLRPSLRRYREDLQAIAAEFCAGFDSDLAVTWPDLAPLSRIVHRLLARESSSTPGRSSEVVPCHGCWARSVCSHSLLQGAAERADIDPRGPSEERCAIWRAEAELGLRLYHRLANTDPLMGLRLFDEPEVALSARDWML